MDHDQIARALKDMDHSEIAKILGRLESATREAENKTREAESKTHDAEIKAAAAAAALVATEKAADKATAAAAAAAKMAADNAAAAAKMAADNAAAAAEMHSERVVNLMAKFHAEVPCVGILSSKVILLTQKSVCCHHRGICTFELETRVLAVLLAYGRPSVCPCHNS